MTEDADRALNRQTDARTDRHVNPLPLPSQDLAGLAQLREQWASMPMIPRLVPDRREGIDNSWAGFDVRTVLIGEQSAGRFTFHDVIVAPGASLAAHHLQGTDTYWVVLDGELEMTVGTRTERAARDAFAFIPENTTQAVHNRSGEPARLFIWYSPAGPERAFALAHQRWIENPHASPDACREALSLLGFTFHRQGEQLPNDNLVNAPVSRLEAQIETFDDYANLRKEWTRRLPVPKLVTGRRGVAEIPMVGQDTLVLLNGDEGSGRCVVFEYRHDPDYRAPAHHQPSEEEIFLILEGTLELTAGNATRNIPRGGFGFIPRYGTHGFVNRTKTRTRTITINSPAGHERGFEMIVREGPSAKLPDLLVAHGWRVHEHYAPPPST